VVDVEGQRLGLVADGVLVSEDLVSTAARGIGGERGSEKTPPGWHRVHGKIGAGEREGMVFVGRKPTGEIWHREPGQADLVLSRILTLEGLEDGVNRGEGVDSLARFIYVHGTNHEPLLGAPASHGCVRMGNTAVIALFDRVIVGDHVVIVG
jgi:UDP-N-acetylmuramate--alanine ligase